jgi:hypothetical protein
MKKPIESSTDQEATKVICPVCKKKVTPSKEAHFFRRTNDFKEHCLHADCWQRVFACRMTLTEFLKKGL